ncbi:MAG: transposase family protein [Pseudanabaena sp.]
MLLLLGFERWFCTQTINQIPFQNIPNTRYLNKDTVIEIIGGGRRATLRSSADKLFFILLYCKCYPTFDLMSVLFGFDRSCAHDWVHRLMPILETALGQKQALPERKIHSIEEFLAKFVDVQSVIIDATERPVQRPRTFTTQKAKR